MSQEDLSRFQRIIDYGVRAAVAKALKRHKALGQSIVVWKDGRIVEIPPEEIVIPEIGPPPED